jgi:hypothetical protein
VSIPHGDTEEKTSDLDTEITKTTIVSDTSSESTSHKTETQLHQSTPTPSTRTVIKFRPSLRASARLRGQWILLLAIYNPLCSEAWVLGNPGYFQKRGESWRTDNMLINVDSINTDIWADHAILKLLDFTTVYIEDGGAIIYEEIDNLTKLAMLIGDVLTIPNMRVSL